MSVSECVLEQEACVSTRMPHDDINRSIPCRPPLVRYTWQHCTAAVPVALTPVGWQTTGAEGRERLEIMLVHIGFSCKGSLALNDQSRTGSFGWKGRGSQPGVLPVVFQEIVTAASAATRASRCPRLHLFVDALGAHRGYTVPPEQHSQAV